MQPKVDVMNEQTPSLGNVHLIVEVTALEGKHVDLREHIASLAQASRGEDGAIRYDVVQDATDKNTYRFIECWRDSAALAAHHLTEHVASFSEKAPPLLAKPYKVVTGCLLEE